MYIQPIEEHKGFISLENTHAVPNRKVFIGKSIGGIYHYKILFTTHYNGNAYLHSYSDLTAEPVLEVNTRQDFELYTLLTIDKLIYAAKNHKVSQLQIGTHDERIIEALHQRGFELRASHDRWRPKFFGRLKCQNSISV